jgi:hypothetical protein
MLKRTNKEKKMIVIRIPDNTVTGKDESAVFDVTIVVSGRKTSRK